MGSPPLSHPFAPLPCSAIVYRAMRSRSWIDKATGEVKPAAFIRRPVNTDGLSVNLVSAATIEDVRRNLRKCYGVVSLHIGRIRNLGLDVQQDSADHANLTDVPLPDEAPAEAEHVARLLARQSRIQWLPPD